MTGTRGHRPSIRKPRSRLNRFEDAIAPTKKPEKSNYGSTLAPRRRAWENLLPMGNGCSKYKGPER